MLLRAPAMIALMRHRGHDRGLSIIPAAGRDAGQRADGRARPVSRDQQARPKRRASGKRDIERRRRCGRCKARDRIRPQLHTDRTGTGEQRRLQRAVLHHVGERLARFDIAIEGQKHWPHRVREAAVGHRHVEDRLRISRDLVPDPDRGQEALCGRHDGGGPRIVGRRVETGIHDRDGKSFAEAFAQRNREREACKARPGNQHIRARSIRFRDHGSSAQKAAGAS